MGARQVGKSTLGQEIARLRGMAYRTLDDRDVLQQAKADPEGLLADLGENGFIDEVQRVPGLFLAIKGIVDRRQEPGQYLLSGSNQPVVSTGIADSLLGRVAYRSLRPLTLSEMRFDEMQSGWDFLFKGTIDDAIDELTRRADGSGELDWKASAETGGFPRAVAAPESVRRRLLDDYVTTFARRDIRELLAVESSDRFEQLLRLVATRTGQVLNVNSLANDAAISVSTAQRWLDALQRSYLIERIPALSRNAGHRVIKSPKLFMIDSALAMAAARETTPSGFHLENLVVNDLCVWKDSEPGRALHHWRTQSGQEADFIVESDGALLAVESKTASRVNAGDARHLRVFLGAHNEAVRGLLLSADPDIREISENIIAAPWWAVL